MPDDVPRVMICGKRKRERERKMMLLVSYASSCKIWENFPGDADDADNFAGDAATAAISTPLFDYYFFLLKLGRANSPLPTSLLSTLTGK